MALEMLTEKAISDSAWCPMMWRDHQGLSKRVKPGRDWDPLENIQKALMSGSQNKSALIRENGFSRRADPYGSEFWIHVPTENGIFLVTVKNLVLDPYHGTDRTVTLNREPRYDPRTEDHITAEKHLHHLILKHLQHWFSVENFKVITTYPQSPSLETEVSTDPEKEKAENWATEMVGMWEGSTVLSPRTDRCPSCFWKECPAKTTPSSVISLKTGKYRGTGNLD